MTDKKPYDHKAVGRYNPKPLYEPNPVRADTGYTSEAVRPPRLPGITEIKARSKLISPRESPLKEWWKKEMGINY